MNADWRLQVALALINAIQIIMLAVINRRGIRTETKLNGHLARHEELSRDLAASMPPRQAAPGGQVDE